MSEEFKRPTNYIGGKQACKILGVHQRTLYNWDEKGLIDVIRTPGGKRLYNVDKYLKDTDTNIIKLPDENTKRYNICYVRVSSNAQKDDLVRQRKYMEERYPNYKIIEDIGSGINFNRKGLQKIIYMAIEGKINKLVVAHKDRLTRFGFELIENIIEKYSKGKIKLVNKEIYEKPENEIVKDLLQIMNVYTAKINGLRKYKKIEKK